MPFKPAGTITGLYREDYNYIPGDSRFQPYHDVAREIKVPHASLINGVLPRDSYGINLRQGAQAVRKPAPYGLLDRQEQPDGDFGDNGLNWMCNVSWKQLQPDAQGQALQGSRTKIGTLTTALTKNRFNPNGKQLQVSGGTDTSGVPSAFKSGTTIVADGYAVVQLDDRAGHTQVVVLATNIANAATQVKPNDFMPNFAYPANTTDIYFLTGTAWIDAAVTWAYAKFGRWVRITFYCGNLAPNWAKAIQPAGSPTLTDGLTPALPRMEIDLATVLVAGTTGPMWDANYRAAYQDVINKLGARYDGEPVIQAIDVSGGGTLFMEPCLRHMSYSSGAGKVNAEVQSLLVIGGYTHAADVAMLGNYMDDVKAAFPSTPISHAMNSFNHVTVGLGPYAVTSYTGAPVTVVNFTGTSFPTTSWSTSTSAVFIFFYSGRVSSTVGNPAGNTTFTVEAVGINSAALQATATLVTNNAGMFYVRLAGTSYQIANGGINAATGVITLNTALDASSTIDNNFQSYPFFICDRTGLTSYAISAATATSVTIASGPNPAPVAGGYATVHRSSNADETVTATLMDTFRSKLGSQGVLGNDSIAADNTPPTGGTSLFADIVARGNPVYYQTNGDNTTNGSLLGLQRNLPLCITNSVGMAALWVEVPKGYISTQDFSLAGLTTGAYSAAAPNVIQVTGTTSWGTSNRWAGGPGTYSRLTYPISGNVYYIATNTATALTGFGASVVDSTVQASKALAVDIAASYVITGGITIAAGGFGIAVTAAGLYLLVDSATGNTFVCIAAAAISSATALGVTGVPQGSTTVNAAYPAATTTVYYCPLAVADQASGLVPTLTHWNALTPAEAAAYTASVPIST